VSTRVALAILSGLLLFASFPPLDLGWLAWIALTPLVLAIHRLPLRRAFGVGYLAGLVGFGGILAWIRVFGLLPWVLLTGYMALYPAAFAAATRWFVGGRPPWRWVWLAALAWEGLEYLRSIGVFGFPWALLGLTQHRLLPVIQVARYAGVFGASFLVALASIALAAALQVRRPAPLVLPLILVALAAGWGAQQVRAAPGGSLMVAAVQPNVPQGQKFDPALAPVHMESLRRLTGDAGRRGADVIVFPETAVPLNLFGPGGALVEIGRWAQAARATVIASSLEHGVSNIAVAVAPSGMAVGRYDKVRLVAFGEAGIVRGAHVEPVWTPLGPVGVAICFESIFPDVTRALVRNGAQILAVITNDAWFDGTAGPAQHAAHAVLRAVESGRWVVRAANTGLSMVIDPTGRVRAAIAPGQAAVLTAPAATVTAMTAYARRGDLFAWAGLIVLLVAAAPYLVAAVSVEWTRPAFQQAAAAAVLPGVAAAVLLSTRAPWWVLPALLLAFVGTFALLQPPYASGPMTAARRRRRQSSWNALALTLVSSLAVVLGLWSVMAAAFRASGVSLPPLRPDDWLAFGVRALLVAAAIELWVRGAVFRPLVEWRGPPAAVAVTTALGLVLQAGLPPEAFAWTLVTGAFFGMIRARTGSPVGLILPHAVGAALFSVIAAVR